MPDPDDDAPLIGIDLGTSTCEACVFRRGVFHKIQPDRYYFPRGYTGLLQDASHEMPSAFAWVDGDIRTGNRALELLSEPANVAGRVLVEIKREMEREGIETFTSGDRAFRPSEIAGYYVQVLRSAAEKQLGLDDGAITGGVVAIPASFGQKEIDATRQACRLGGLNRDRTRLIDEPVAAAYALKLHEQPGAQVVLVADLGGGTFDVTLLRVGRDVGDLGYEELGRDGELRLGGLDWDDEIVRRVAHGTLAKSGVDIGFLNARSPADAHARIARTRMFEAAERAKRIFYDQFDKFPKTAPFPAPKDLRRMDFEIVLEKGHKPYNGVIPAEVHLNDTAGLVARCLAVCKRLFRDVSDDQKTPYGWEKVDAIYLAGGGSRMATVRHAFADAWGREPRVAPDPQHAVARGASLCAEEIRTGRDVRHLGKRRYPHAVGIASYRSTADGRGTRLFEKLVPRHATLPFAEPVIARFRSNMPPGVHRLAIEIEEESLALVNHAAGRNGHNGTPPSHKPVETLKMRNLPPPIPGAEDNIAIHVDGDADGLLHFRVEFRGDSLDFDYDHGSAE